MDRASFTQESLENLKLISNNVWSTFDYDNDFKDVFANIARTESLLSHRFQTDSTVDILSDLQNTIPDKNSAKHQQQEPVESIFDGDIFQYKDEVGATEPIPDYSSNKVENAYWEEVKTVGCERQPVNEVNVTYNNAFDPRLTFNGLWTDHVHLDDLEKDVNAQQNVYINADDVSDIVDEYFNKYRNYLQNLSGSRKDQREVARNILACQPKGLTASQLKHFDLKSCWTDEAERKLVEKLNSERIKNIWRVGDPLPHTDDQKIQYENETDLRRTGNLSRDDPLAVSIDNYISTSLEPNKVQQFANLSHEMSARSRNTWKEAWAEDKNLKPEESRIPTTRQDGRDDWRNPDITQGRNSTSSVKFDLQIIDGNVKILARNVDNQTVHNPQQNISRSTRVLSDCKPYDDTKCRSTSKASSDTSVFMEEGRSFQVHPSSRSHRDRAKSMKSESSLAKGESDSTNYQTPSSPEQPRSPRETSRSSFVEGRQTVQHCNGEVQPSTGRSEIFPQTQKLPHQPGTHQQGHAGHLNPERGFTNTRGPALPKDVSSEIRVPDELDKYMARKDEKFYNMLKQYGWYDDNFGNKNQKKAEEYSTGCNWPPNLESQSQFHHTTSQPASTAQYPHTPKRQLFRSPSPTKRYVTNSTKKYVQVAEKGFENNFEYFNRSGSMSPVKRQALQNASFNSQTSSPNTDSPLSSLFNNSPEPKKTASQLNAACEPFIPAHLQPTQDNSRYSSPVKSHTETQQVKCQTPNKEAIKKLLQSPEVTMPMMTNNEAAHAFLLQQKLQQLQKQCSLSSYQQPVTSAPIFSRASSLQTQSIPQQQLITSHHQQQQQQKQQQALLNHQQQIRESLHQSPQSNFQQRDNVLGSSQLYSQKHPQLQFAHPQLQLSQPPPIVRTNTLVPGWPPQVPQVSRPLGVNISFPEARPRTVPMQQRYVQPLITWQAFPGFPAHPRFLHHPLFNVNNNSGGYDEYGYGLSSVSSSSSESLVSYLDSDVDAPVPAPAPPRSARPIRANPANLIHINTK